LTFFASFSHSLKRLVCGLQQVETPMPSKYHGKILKTNPTKRQTSQLTEIPTKQDPKILVVQSSKSN